MMRQKILIFLTVIFTGFLVFKLIKYNIVIKNIDFIEKSKYGKYIELFMIQNDRIPESIEEINEFVKDRDSELSENIRKIGVNYLKTDNHSFDLYVNGFDNEDDYLENSYDYQNVGFFKSLFIKGDINLDLYFKFKRKTNTFYTVEDKTLKEESAFDLLKVYRKTLDCEKIIEKNMNYSDYKSVEIKINNKEISYHNNSFSQKTLDLIKLNLKEQKTYINSTKLYIIKIVGVNLDDYKCIKNR